MGWMKQIYVMCQDGTFEQEFTQKYEEAKKAKKDTMEFSGTEITMSQAEGIEQLANDTKYMFNNP